MFTKKDVYDIQSNVFSDITKDWVLISAKKPDGTFNSMTASWGAMGVIWGHEAVTVYIRQSRFTKEFVDSSDYFTVSLFTGHKEELGPIFGRKSGRDVDKAAEAGFTPVMIEGQPTYEESRAVFICRKRYKADIPMESMPEEICEKFYPDSNYHTMYIGEIVSYYEN